MKKHWHEVDICVLFVSLLRNISSEALLLFSLWFGFVIREVGDLIIILSMTSIVIGLYTECSSEMELWLLKLQRVRFEISGLIHICYICLYECI